MTNRDRLATPPRNVMPIQHVEEAKRVLATVLPRQLQGTSLTSEPNQFFAASIITPLRKSSSS